MSAIEVKVRGDDRPTLLEKAEQDLLLCQSELRTFHWNQNRVDLMVVLFEQVIRASRTSTDDEALYQSYLTIRESIESWWFEGEFKRIFRETLSALERGEVRRKESVLATMSEPAPVLTVFNPHHTMMLQKTLEKKDGFLKKARNGLVQSDQKIQTLTKENIALKQKNAQLEEENARLSSSSASIPIPEGSKLLSEHKSASASTSSSWDSPFSQPHSVSSFSPKQSCLSHEGQGNQLERGSPASVFTH